MNPIHSKSLTPSLTRFSDEKLANGSAPMSKAVSGENNNVSQSLQSEPSFADENYDAYPTEGGLQGVNGEQDKPGGPLASPARSRWITAFAKVCVSTTNLFIYYFCSDLFLYRFYLLYVYLTLLFYSI